MLEMSISVEDEIPEEWETRFQGCKQYVACGPRDVLVIKSNESLSSPDIEPRKKGVVTEEDKEKLKRDDIPMEYWEDEIQILLAKMRKEERYNILPIEDDPDMTSNYILEKIKLLFQTTKKPGVCIIYFGPGKKATGDWCFVDGYISFTDIKALHSEYFFEKTLGIVSDCSYSGHWVQLLMEFFDNCKIAPCLHAGRSCGVLISIATSCQQDEVPYTHLFVNRAFYNDKNTGSFVLRYPEHLAAHQNVRYCGNTEMICNADNIDSECLLPQGFTFEKSRRSQRLFMTHCLSGDGWILFIADDDDEVLYQINTGEVDPMECGEIVLSGCGRRPNERDIEWIERTYPDHLFDWSRI